MTTPREEAIAFLQQIGSDSETDVYSIHIKDIERLVRAAQIRALEDIHADTYEHPSGAYIIRAKIEELRK